MRAYFIELRERTLAVFDRSLQKIMLRSTSINQIIQKLIQALPQPLWKAMFFGKQHYCSVCQSHVRCFLPFGEVDPRPNALCPVCGSFERHRLLWTFLQRKTSLLGPPSKALLHIAPERKLAPRLRQNPNI